MLIGKIRPFAAFDFDVSYHLWTRSDGRIEGSLTVSAFDEAMALIGNRRAGDLLLEDGRRFIFSVIEFVPPGMFFVEGSMQEAAPC